MWLILRDLEIDFVGHFELDGNGYLDPVVKGVNINFGESDYV